MLLFLINWKLSNSYKKPAVYGKVNFQGVWEYTITHWSLKYNRKIFNSFLMEVPII